MFCIMEEKTELTEITTCLGLRDHIKVFAENGYQTLSDFLHLTEKDLREMGIESGEEHKRLSHGEK